MKSFVYEKQMLLYLYRNVFCRQRYPEGYKAPAGVPAPGPVPDDGRAAGRAPACGVVAGAAGVGPVADPAVPPAVIAPDPIPVEVAEVEVNAEGM